MATDGLQKIINEIEKSTEQKVSVILSEAEKKADAILNDAKKKAEEQERSILDRGEQEAQRESQRILAEARIRARREKVMAQEKVVQRSFEKASDILSTTAESQNAEVLKSLIKESVDASGALSFEVLLTSRDRGLVTKDSLLEIVRQTDAGRGSDIESRISEEVLSCMGGVVVRSTDGKVRVDNTFEARLERFRDGIRMRVAKELFGQDS